MPQFNACFGCVTDEKPKYQQQAIFLLASLRALGGDYANAEFFLCVVGEMAAPLAASARSLGARVVTVPALSSSLPATNKLRFFQIPELRAHDYCVLLDCDTAVADSPAGLFGGAGVRGRMAGGPTVPPAVLADLFASSALPPQAADCLTAVTRDRIPLYVNSGVLVVARDVLDRFAGSWLRHQDRLLARPHLLPGCVVHTNQASLSLALVESGVAFQPLDLGFNFPVHRPPASFITPEIHMVRPTILHYNFTADDWTLRPSPALMANAAIDRVNAEWRRYRAGPGRL